MATKTIKKATKKSSPTTRQRNAKIDSSIKKDIAELRKQIEDQQDLIISSFSSDEIREAIQSEISIEEIVDELENIQFGDPEQLQTLGRIIQHVALTFSDKYQSDVTKIVDTRHILTKSVNGKMANMHSSLKYIQRYMTNGYEKSENPIDLLKAIHYLIFEFTRIQKFK